MPAIDTAEDAANTAELFVSKYHPFRVLKRAVQQGDEWVVEFDVGVLRTEIVRMKLDALTGNVLEYGEVQESGKYPTSSQP